MHRDMGPVVTYFLGALNKPPLVASLFLLSRQKIMHEKLQKSDKKEGARVGAPGKSETNSCEVEHEIRAQGCRHCNE